MVYKDQGEMFAHVTVGMEQRIRLLSEQQAAITIKRLRYTEVTYGRFNIFGVDRVEGTVLWKLPTKVKAPLKSAAVQPVDFLAGIFATGGPRGKAHSKSEVERPKRPEMAQPLCNGEYDMLEEALGEIIMDADFEADHDHLVDAVYADCGMAGLDEAAGDDAVDFDSDLDNDGPDVEDEDVGVDEPAIVSHYVETLRSIGVEDGGSIGFSYRGRRIGKVMGPLFGNNSFKAECAKHSKCACMFSSKLPKPQSSDEAVTLDLVKWLRMPFCEDMTAAEHREAAIALKESHGVRPRVGAAGLGK